MTSTTPILRGSRQELARLFAQRVAASLPQVRSVVLYGSVARDADTQWSDIDLLVLTEGADSRVRERIFDVELAVHEEEPSVIISPAIYPAGDFAGMLRGGFPYARRVIEDGLVLVDDGTYAALCAEAIELFVNWSERMGNPNNEYVKDKLERAQEALSVARLSHEHDFYWSAADRAYYCMLHAAEAAVAMTGVEPGKTHDGVIDQFGRHVAKKGLLPRRFHDELSHAKPIREDSTYGGPKAAGRREAAHLIALVQRLLAHVQRLAEEKRE